MLSENWRNLNYNPKLILKSTLDTNQKKFVKDCINYDIIIKNVGNIIIHNINISDLLYNNQHILERKSYNIDRLIIGESRSFSTQLNQFLLEDIYTHQVRATCNELNFTLDTPLITIIADMPIYIADAKNHKIYKYNMLGELKLIFRSANPYGLVVDKLNCVYVSDSYSNIVYKYTQDGHLLNILNNNFYFPSGLAIDDNNNLYVVDTFNYKIQKFTSSGMFMYELEFPNIFNIAYGICLDKNNNIYVTDIDKGVIHIISTNTSNHKFLTNNNNSELFMKPHAICTDSNNNIYVLDTNRSQVKKYDSNYNLILVFGGYGSQENKFKRPQGICIDRFDNIYIADTYNNKVKKFNSNGVFITQFKAISGLISAISTV